MATRLGFAAAVTAIAFAVGAPAQARLVDVVEFYNATLDHYFISALADDIAALDSGKFAGWSRTGLGFQAYDSPTAGMSPVCRFYIPPAAGDSHFYSASPAECAEVRTKFPSFDYESPAVMYVGLPDAATGACGAGTAPVYRLWNNRADTNHRYTTDLAVRSAMLAKGYVAEGYGSEGVAMCAAAPPSLFEITLAPASVLLTPGESRDVYVTVRPRNGFAGPVSLAAAGLPAGISQQLALSSVDVGPGLQSTTVRVTAAGSAAPTASLARAAMTGTESGGFTSSAILSVGIAAPGDPVHATLAAIAAVESRLLALRAQALAPAERVQAIAAFMQARPECEAAGADVGSLSAWGRFRDGTLHIVVQNRAPTANASSDPQPRLEARSGAQIPQATKATVLQTFGRKFHPRTAVDEVRGFLVGKGWNVAGGALGEGTVGTLKGVRGNGFFFMSSHGGLGDIGNPAYPRGIFAVQSATLVDDDYERLFVLDVATRRLVRMTAENGESVTIDGIPVPASDTRYGITFLFVETYMDFAKGSVVFMNACKSAQGQEFVDAFLKKGAGVYLGWSELVSSGAADAAGQYFVDRMLGANQHSPKESPPQRAFPYDAVLKDMATKGLDKDTQNNGTLQAFPSSIVTEPPILAPSIRMVAIDEINGLLTLSGYFGARPEAGKDIVRVGGTALSVVSWVADEIVATLPLTGAGSNGDVVVETRGVKSNARQITQWSVGVDFTQTVSTFGFQGELQYKGNGTMRFRGDVAGWRTEPGGPVKFVERGGFATKDSKIAVTASGSISVPGCISTASGSFDYVSIAARNGLSDGLPVTRALFSVQADTKAAAYGFFLEGELFVHVVLSCDGKKTYTIASMGMLDGLLLLPDSQVEDPNYSGVPGYQFALDASYGMPAQTSTDTASPFIDKVVATMKAAAATSPPRDDDDSGK